METNPDLTFDNSITRPGAVLAWAQQLLRDHRTGRPRRLAAEAIWRVLEEEWPTFDRIDHVDYHALLHRISRWWRPTPRVLALPDRFTIYRGQSADDCIGLSWALSCPVAESFARGHRGIRVRNPQILTATIGRADVALALDDRGEAEVVLWSIPRQFSQRTTKT